MAMIANELYRFDDFELQPSRRYLLRAGEKVALAPKTFEVLLCLVQRPGQVVLKEELLRAVWPDSFVEESNLTQHVFWLRKALGDKSGYVVTIPGRGYEFIGKVHAVPEAGSVAGPVAGPVAGSVAGPVAGPEAAPVVVSVSLQQTVEHTEIVFEESSIAAPRRVRWRPALAAGLAVAAALGGWGWTHWLHRPFAGDRHEVVLADFENTSGDAGFDSALKTLLAIDLNESPFLTVAGGTDVKQVLQLMQHRPDEALTPAVAREVCQRMNDQVVIGGEIARFGQKYLVALSASDCASGRDLARTKAVADSREGVLKAVDTVAADLRKRLGEPLKSLPRPEQPLEFQHTSSLEALRLYSRAVALQAASKDEDALTLLRRAVELDPNFVAAYANMAQVYGILMEPNLGEQAITKAYELRDQADEPTRLWVTALYNQEVTGDLFAMLRTYEIWTATYPRRADAWERLADTQLRLRRPARAIESLERSIALNPRNPYAHSQLAYAQFAAGKDAEAEATCREAIRRHEAGVDLEYRLMQIEILHGDAAAVKAHVAAVAGTEAESPMAWLLADWMFQQGRMRAGLAEHARSMALYRSHGLSESADTLDRDVPYVMAEMGLPEQARRALRELGARPGSQAGSQTGSQTGSQAGSQAGSQTDDWTVMLGYAAAGEPAEAEALLKQYAPKHASDTSLQAGGYPLVRAAIAMAQHNPEQAVAALAAAEPYGDEDLEPQVPYWRGLGYLALKQPEQAAVEFRKVTEPPHLEPSSFTIALAHLGLARALEMQGNHAASRKEYETLFALWKDADPDLPPLVQARAEYSRIP